MHTARARAYPHRPPTRPLIPSVSRPLVAINVRREVRRHRGTLARFRLIAHGTWHARLSATARAWMVVPGSVGVRLADPTRIPAVDARHWCRTAIRRFRSCGGILKALSFCAASMALFSSGASTMPPNAAGVAVRRRISQLRSCSRLRLRIARVYGRGRRQRPGARA